MNSTDEAVILRRQKIEPGKVEELREWFEAHVEDERAVQAALRDRGIRAESAFVQSTTDGAYLIYFAEVDDAPATDVESDPKSREVAERFLEGGADTDGRATADLLFHIVVQADRR